MSVEITRNGETIDTLREEFSDFVCDSIYNEERILTSGGEVHWPEGPGFRQGTLDGKPFVANLQVGDRFGWFTVVRLGRVWERNGVPIRYAYFTWGK